MINALFFLIWNSWLNRLKMRVRRLKQPKYLIGSIFGLLYLFYMVGMRFMWGTMHSGQAAKGAITPENEQMYESLAALILFVLVFLAWVVPRERGALVFSEA